MNQNVASNGTVGTGKQLVSFGNAIQALRDGKRVQRSGWNGKDLFVFMQVPSEVPAEFVPRMSSLPKSVKAEFKRRFEDESAQIDALYYNDQLALVNPSNLISGWAPSTNDALANDWIILD